MQCINTVFPSYCNPAVQNISTVILRLTTSETRRNGKMLGRAESKKLERITCDQSSVLVPPSQLGVNRTISSSTHFRGQAPVKNFSVAGMSGNSADRFGEGHLDFVRRVWFTPDKLTLYEHRFCLVAIVLTHHFLATPLVLLLLFIWWEGHSTCKSHSLRTATVQSIP